jgi:hypothetical protein
MNTDTNLIQIKSVYHKIQSCFKDGTDVCKNSWVDFSITHALNTIRKYLQLDSNGNAAEYVTWLRLFLNLQNKFNIKCNLNTSANGQSKANLKRKINKQSRRIASYFSHIPLKKWGWRKSIEKLKRLHEKWYNEGKIECNYNEFEQYFFGAIKVFKPLTWKVEVGELVHWIRELMNANIIPYHHHYLKLAHHNFIDPNGHSFNYASFKTMALRRIAKDVENNIRETINELKN